MAPDDAAATWDAAADTFDDEPHHALSDPVIRGAWWDVLERVLPAPPARVVDLGCGTGSLSVLLAEHGHQVVGLDVSPRMLGLARAKAQRRGVDVTFVLGDASAPPMGEAGIDVVVTRHVVWALEDRAAAIDVWLRLLAPGGRLVLVEGRWHTGAGVASDELDGLLARPGVRTEVVDLSDPLLWGHPLTDSRYLLVAST